MNGVVNPMNLTNMCDSRYQILRILKKEACTVDVLSSKIGISPTAVRQHLTILERESLIEGETIKEGIGRPKVSYSTTDKAEVFFPKYYDWLAEHLIADIIQREGEEKAADILVRIGKIFSQPYLEQVENKPLKERVKVAADILNEWGGYACVEDNGDSYVLKSYNCSFYDVAQKYPVVCCVHDKFLEQLLNQMPERTESMAEGDNCCVYHIKE